MAMLLILTLNLPWSLVSGVHSDEEVINAALASLRSFSAPACLQSVSLTDNTS